MVARRLLPLGLLMEMRHGDCLNRQKGLDAPVQSTNESRSCNVRDRTPIEGVALQSPVPDTATSDQRSLLRFRCFGAMSSTHVRFRWSFVPKHASTFCWPISRSSVKGEPLIWQTEEGPS